jgi:hypothetical protein
VSPSCPTELARLAAPTMAVRSWPPRLTKAGKSGNAEEGSIAFLFFLIFINWHITIAISTKMCHNI